MKKWGPRLPRGPERRTIMQLVSTLATGEAQPRRKSPRNQLGDLAQRIHTEHEASRSRHKIWR